MKFLHRKAQGTETVREEGTVIHREIEITVEREWLAVPSAEHGGDGMQEVNLPVLKLPPFTKLE